MSVHPSNCSVHSSIHSVRLYICLFISFVPPSVHSFSSSNHAVWPYIYLSVNLSISLSIRSVHPSLCLSIRQYNCLSNLSLNLVPPSVHLSIDTRHPFSLSGRPSVQSVHLSIQTLLIGPSVISRGISIQPTEMTRPVKVSSINIPVNRLSVCVQSAVCPSVCIHSVLSFDANFSSFSLAKSPPGDLQITAYK